MNDADNRTDRAAAIWLAIGSLISLIGSPLAYGAQGYDSLQNRPLPKTPAERTSECAWIRSEEARVQAQAEAGVATAEKYNPAMAQSITAEASRIQAQLEMRAAQIQCSYIAAAATSGPTAGNPPPAASPPAAKAVTVATALQPSTSPAPSASLQSPAAVQSSIAVQPSPAAQSSAPVQPAAPVPASGAVQSVAPAQAAAATSAAPCAGGGLTFDQCFAKCRELTKRTAEQCFDACRH